MNEKVLEELKEELFRFCPTCGGELVHNLIDKGAGKFCPKHGELVITRVVNRRSTISFKVDVHFPKINLG